MKHREGNLAFKPIAGAICACIAVVSINVNALLIDNDSYTTDIDVVQTVFVGLFWK